MESRSEGPRAGSKILKYFVHYHGWNKNWDEWVPGARWEKNHEET